MFSEKNIIKALKTGTVVIMSILYVGIGFKHFTDPEFFLKIMPPFFKSFDLELVYLSGFFEILFGFLLLFQKYRKIAGIGLILLLIAVFPANIYLYQNPEILNTEESKVLMRLFFQLPLVSIAFWLSQNNTSRLFSVFCILIFIPTIIYFLTLSIN